MQLKPSFLFILFTLLSSSFGFSIAIGCKGGNGDQLVASTIIVDKSGHGKFNTIQDAIDSIPPNNNRWIKIQINPGVYIEQVTIPKEKPCIVLEGQDRRLTTITYNANASTDTSSTFTSYPDSVVAKRITFENTFNHPLMMQYEFDLIAFLNIKQALAARIYGDKSAFYECGFVGLQDTLWDARGRHYFKNCYIEGAIDFIFGDGQSFYEDCAINATAGTLSSRVSSGYITAQGRSSSLDPGGFIFSGGAVFGDLQVYLGRAYGPYSRVIFQGTTLGSVVNPQGWNSWRFPGKEFNFMYAEVNCNGPGSNISKRVRWEKKIRLTQINQFSRSSFIDKDGWIAKLP